MRKNQTPWRNNKNGEIIYGHTRTLSIIQWFVVLSYDLILFRYVYQFIYSHHVYTLETLSVGSHLWSLLKLSSHLVFTHLFCSSPSHLNAKSHISLYPSCSELIWYRSHLTYPIFSFRHFSGFGSKPFCDNLGFF